MILQEKILFSKEECDYIINLSKELDKVNPFGKSDHASKNKTFKVNYDVWVINRNDKTQWIFNKINIIYNRKNFYQV
jgi:Uri superfamily endonuclease